MSEKIWVCTITHNHAWWLPYFFNHYSFANGFIIHDNDSTDDTKEVCEKFGVKAKDLHSVGFDESTLIQCRNSAWKEAKGKADWVIIVDPDELVENPNERDATIIVPRGYEMFGFPDKPSPGTPNDWYSKPCVFRPNLVTEIDFNDGCHVANPKGSLKWDGRMCRPDSEKMQDYKGVDRGIALYNNDPSYSSLKLLHYRYLHGIDKVVERWISSKKRLEVANAKEGIAFQYRYDPQVVLHWFEKLATYAEIIL